MTHLEPASRTHVARTHESASTDEVNSGQLLAIVERIEAVEREIADLNEGKAEIYKEARGNGFDVKIVRKVIKIRAADPSDRTEEETLIELYLNALARA